MKRITKDLEKKAIKELEKEIDDLRKEIAKMQLEFKVNPPKDTNLIFKKRKRLAVLLTILNQKREEEKFKKETK